ncbi:hypothetical protein C8R45DRAFT_930575 [Mycena sanguinolenta]|nr:hypothetical protein C8R45DRAFT_930575 [Mycena sanguinolenta]
MSLHIQEVLPSRFNEAWLSIAGRRGVRTWLSNGLRNATTSKAIDGFMVHTFANSIRAVIGALPLQHHKQEWFSALPAIPDGELQLVLLTRAFVFPTAPHWTEASEPFPLFDSGRLSDPLWLAWEEFADPIDAVPSPLAANSMPSAETVDSIEAVPSPMADTMPPHENEAPQSPEAVEDPPFLSLDTPTPARFRSGVSKRREVSPVRESTPRPSTRVLRRSVRANRQVAAPPPKKAIVTPTKRPVIKTRASRKSTMPSDEYIPPIEALNEGESEVEDEDDETQPSSRRGRRIRVNGLPVRGLGKESQPFVDNGTRTQLPVEALGFALRDHQHVKRKMNHAHCTNCVARGVECTHQGPGLKCKECKQQSRSGCLHSLSHGNFLNIAEDLFPITRYAPSAHVLGDWMQGILASYGPQALPGMDLVPESLRGIWRTMLDKCTLTLQNETEPDLPMPDVPIGAAPEADSPEQHPEPERQVKQEPAKEEEDGEIIEEA